MKKLLLSIGISLTLISCSATKEHIQPENKIKNLNLTCAVGEICDVKLPTGTKINSVRAADTSSWFIDRNQTGEVDKAVEHISIKPLYANFSNMIFVYTTTGLYVINTISLPKSDQEE